MKPEDIRLYGDPSTRWQKVLDDYLLTQGNNKKGIFSTMGPEKLSDSSDSVTRVTLEYTLEGVKQKPLKLIERSLSSKKYKHKNPSRIENETFFIKNIPELLRNMRFQGLPITHLCYELKNKEIDTVFYQEDVGEYNLKELFSSLSKNATNLEKELVEKNAKPLKSIDKKVLEELQSFRKVDIYEDGGEGFIVKLKPKVIKLFNEEELPNYLKFVKRQPEDTYEKVID